MTDNSSPSFDFNPSVGTILQLADGSIQACNPEAARILGYSTQEITQANYYQPPWRTIHPDGSSYPPASHPSILTLKTGQAHAQEIIGFYRPDNTLVWLSVDSQPLYLGNSQEPYGVVVNFRETTNPDVNIIELITEKKQLQIQYQETSFKLQLATEASGIGMWFWDLTSDRLEWTARCNQLFGLDEDATTSYELFLSILHPEDFYRTDKAVKQALANKSDYDIEYRVVWSDGSIHWLAAKGRGFYNQNGEAIRMMGTVQDIDRRKYTEAELVKTDSILRSIINDSSSIIFVKDTAGRYLIVNQAAAEFAGIGAAEMLGKDDQTLFPSDITSSILARDRQVIEEGISLSYEEEVVRGEISRSLLINKYPWRDEEGRILGIIGICRDITALKRSQQQLTEKERLLRLAFASANAGSWDLEIATEKIFWSPENYKLYGLEPQDGSLEYQDWYNKVHPEDRELANQMVQDVLAKKLPQFNHEFRIVHPERGIRWILGIGNATFDHSDRAVRLSGINLDITDRKKMEEKLRHNEQHLRRILDSLYSFVGVLTPEGILIEANRTALEAANLKAEDVIGKPFAQTYWWSYSSEIQAQLNDAIGQATTGELIRYDVEIRLSSKQYVLIDFSLIPLFNNQGEVEYLIPSGIDITERETSKKTLKEREGELRLITEVIPQQVWTALPNGEIDYINERWQEYTNIDLKQLQGDGWSTIVHPEDIENVNQTWKQAIETGTKYNIKARLRRFDGKYYWFLGRARPLRNPQGEIIKWYGTNTDINQIKELEAKLQQQTEDLTEANRIKDEFLAIVSHELRTPLNPILGWSQLLATGSLDEEKSTMGIEIIQRNAKLQAQLIDDLLDVSRILRGKLNLQQTPIHLELIIKSALATVQLAAEAKSIKITTEFEADIGQVLGDAGRLQQIVWNLLSNAIKFTPDGGRVEIKLSSITANGSLTDNQTINTNEQEQITKGKFAQIQVIDTGMGIDPEFSPYVFDRFRQAESTTTRKFGGLGLGLAIVRHLTELHGGTVGVTSLGKNKGATFTVKLPLMNLSSSKSTDSNNPIIESIQPNRFKGINILIVEDEVDSRDILALVLEQEGAKVTPVLSAREAIEVFTASGSSFDLIISDIAMPEVDGYSLMTQIRQLPQGKNIPAIALSAYAGEVYRERSLNAGYQHHFNKPIVIPKLIEIITQLIDS